MTTPILPSDDYPFAEARHPLTDLQMAEVPADLQAIFEASARESGIEIMRDQVVELRCRMPEMDDAVFAVWWPTGEERMHMLVPKQKVVGRA
jgi:hypothetical protein